MKAKFDLIFKTTDGNQVRASRTCRVAHDWTQEEYPGGLVEMEQEEDKKFKNQDRIAFYFGKRPITLASFNISSKDSAIIPKNTTMYLNPPRTIIEEEDCLVFAAGDFEIQVQ